MKVLDPAKPGQHGATLSFQQQGPRGEITNMTPVPEVRPPPWRPLSRAGNTPRRVADLWSAGSASISRPRPVPPRVPRTHSIVEMTQHQCP